MEHIDPTLLRIIFSVLGFVVLSLTGIIVWLFKNLNEKITLLSFNNSDVQVSLVKIDRDLNGLQKSIERELDLIKDSQEEISKKVNQHSNDITLIGKEVSAIVEWKRILTKIE